MTTMNSTTWSEHDVFIDTSGKYRCRILSRGDGHLLLEMWGMQGARRHTFSLSEKFWVSRACGWRLLGAVDRLAKGEG